MKSKMKRQKNELVQGIGELVTRVQQLARKAKQQYELEVEYVLKAQCRDSGRIEQLLDGMLDFCFDDAMLCLYKKLCRYYFTIDPEATVSYVYAYREMWDEEEES